MTRSRGSGTKLDRPSFFCGLLGRQTTKGDRPPHSCGMVAGGSGTDHRFFFFSSRRRHTRLQGEWSSDVCSSDLGSPAETCRRRLRRPGRSTWPDRRSASAGPRSSSTTLLAFCTNWHIMCRQGVSDDMVQNEEARPRGRPREYDPEVALQQAMDAFWDTGFSGTSLDDLSTRTGMNRPSLYAAFGDKQALYLKTLEAYLADRRKAVAAALAAGRPLRETLREIYETVLDRFLEGDRGARGCYLVGTAATEAVDNPEVREALARSLRELDGGFREAFSRA